MYKTNQHSSHVGNSRVFCYLNVPYTEKDQVKRLGGRYDSTKKKWYVPHRMDIFPFLKWMPMEIQSQMKSIAKTDRQFASRN
jgi:hypothetical protein